MNLAFSGCCAVVAAATAWPASALIEAIESRTGVASAGSAEVVGQASDRRRIAAGRWLLAALLAASVFGLTVRLQPELVAAAACWLTICGVPLAAIDIRVRRLPNGLTVASLAGVLFLLAITAIATAYRPNLLGAVVSGLAVGGSFWLLAVARPGSAGLGDAKLGLSTGALAGWFGWRVTLASVVAAFVLAAAYGLWLVATRRARLHGTSLPFGPFMLAGCLTIVVLTGTG